MEPRRMCFTGVRKGVDMGGKKQGEVGGRRERRRNISSKCGKVGRNLNSHFPQNDSHFVRILRETGHTVAS